MARLQRLAPSPRRPEALLQARRRDRVAASRPDAHDVAELVTIPISAERGQRHHLVLVGGRQKAEVGGDLLVEQAQRVRHIDLAQTIQARAIAKAVGRSGPFTTTVERQHGGMDERRDVEGAGRVGDVVLHEAPVK